MGCVGLFVKDIVNARLCISGIGFNMKGSCKHILNHFRKPQRQFFKKQFLVALTLTVLRC